MFLKTGGYRWEDREPVCWKTGIGEDLIDMGTFRVSTEIARGRTEEAIAHRFDRGRKQSASVPGRAHGLADRQTLLTNFRAGMSDDVLKSIIQV